MNEQPCPFCGRPREADGGIIHPASCEGLQDSEMNKLQERILRDELSAALLKLDGFQKVVRHVLFHWDAVLPGDAAKRLHDLVGDYGEADAEEQK